MISESGERPRGTLDNPARIALLVSGTVSEGNASSGEVPVTSPAPGGPPGASASEQGAPRPAGRRLTWVYVTVVIVILVALSGTFYVVAGRTHHSSSSSTTVLVGRGTLYGLPGEQFDAVEVTVSSSVILNGTVDNQYGFVLYRMSGAQVTEFSISGNVTKAGFEWTSGYIQNGATYYIEQTFPSGNWDLVFYNPSTNALTDCYIGFVTDLIEEPS